METCHGPQSVICQVVAAALLNLAWWVGLSPCTHNDGQVAQVRKRITDRAIIYHSMHQPLLSESEALRGMHLVAIWVAW
eukprot:226362-Amphidinium_carterae.1